MKKPIAFCLLFVFVFSPLFCQELSSSPLDNILEIITELETIARERNGLVGSLQTANEEQKKEILEREAELSAREKDLKERETELRRQTEISNDLGLLVKEKTSYSRTLEKKLVFYQTTTVTFAASSLVLVIVILANK